MQIAYKALFEFLIELIDIQIKKYVSLTRIGIGPDADINAYLVREEVNELLEFAYQLLTAMESKFYNTAVDYRALLISIFCQVKCYLNQEDLRAHAGWLLDENNIHNPLRARVKAQLCQLNTIGQSAGIAESIISSPITLIQKQCEHDSHMIAFRILDVAKQLKANPTLELDLKIPQHAQKILRRNIEIRYKKEPFAKSIDELHQRCSAFLKQSRLKTSNIPLTYHDAKLKEDEDRNTLNKLLKRYQKIEPHSRIYLEAHTWLKIGRQPVTKQPHSSYSSHKLKLFGGIVLASSLLIYAVLPYFYFNQNNETKLRP